MGRSYQSSQCHVRVESDVRGKWSHLRRCHERKVTLCRPSPVDSTSEYTITFDCALSSHCLHAFPFHVLISGSLFNKFALLLVCAGQGGAVCSSDSPCLLCVPSEDGVWVHL